jgi:hypothetical protein
MALTGSSTFEWACSVLTYLRNTCGYSFQITVATKMKKHIFQPYCLARFAMSEKSHHYCQAFEMGHLNLPSKSEMSWRAGNELAAADGCL